MKCKSKKKKVKLYQFYINNPSKNSLNNNFKSNAIHTTKYNILTFLPKTLFYQFCRFANCYFLFCAILQCIPQISPLGASTAIIPLVIVLIVSLVREAIEDLQRYKLDKVQNSEIIEVFRDNKWQKIQSGKLKLGELILVKQGYVFPADLILIDSNLKEGICFIETASLDGEKTLKVKRSPSELAGLFTSETSKPEIPLLEGKIICEEPNPNLYSLNGSMEMKFQINKESKLVKSTIAIDQNQLLVKGAVLKNTQFIMGIIIYTGNNCKIIQNSRKPKMKYSTNEKLMNKAIIFVMILQSLLCIICGVLRGIYYTKYTERNPYLNYPLFPYVESGVITYFTYTLLLNTMIPISLIITMEIIRIIQGQFISVDCDGYSFNKKAFIKPNSVSLNEELGIVDYIFTDKTGTLTCNKLKFKYCVIGDICYKYIGNEKDNNQKIKKEESQILLENNSENIIEEFGDYDMWKKSQIENGMKVERKIYKNFIIYHKDSKGEETKLSLCNISSIIQEFWTALVLCNDCTIQIEEKYDMKNKRKEKIEEYIGTSPDNIELVKAAKNQCFQLIPSSSFSEKIVRIGKDEHIYEKKYDILYLIEFTSERKRESIIVKDSNIIKLYIKGADSVIEERLNKKTPNQIKKNCKQYVEKFSSLGYRTLFIGMKLLSKTEYEQFKFDIQKASLDLKTKKDRMNEIFDSIEKDIYLLGATIVEDKLQDQVPETIKDLRLAGIKIWMITGDKMNTAHNIALSCNLLTSSMKIFTIQGTQIVKDKTCNIKNLNEKINPINHFFSEYEKFNEKSKENQLRAFGIIIDEKALITIIEDKSIQRQFIQIAKCADAVICCRVSPLQKSQIVKMMKSYSPNSITLSIGDGGNDVSMILESHIGIGVYGEEGMRAVQASDFAIGEFKVLHRLLFFHGRINYIRNSEAVLYFFYKNFVFTIVQFYFGFYNCFTGQTIIYDWFITLYNLIFTSFSLGVKACMDFDVIPTDGKIIKLMMPFIYGETKNNKIFTKLNFFLSLFKGIIHCSLNYFFMIYSLYNKPFSDGSQPGLLYIDVGLFTNIIFIVTFDLVIFTRYHTWIHFVVMIFFSFVAYFLFLIIMRYLFIPDPSIIMIYAFNTGILYLNILFITGVCILVDVCIKSISFLFYPTLSNELSKQVVTKKIKNNDLPKKIIEKLTLY